MNQTRIAIVTGANRGIGFETVRQLALIGTKVILTARDEKKGKQSYEKLKKTGDIKFHQLDVTDRESIKNLYEYIQKEFGRLDILVNNAGVYLDKNIEVLNVDLETVKRTMETNLYGPLLLSQTFIPLMEKNNYGRIVNVSSGMGQLKSFLGIGPASSGYRISKTSLNMLTCILSDAVRGYNILINSVCPGWVKTEMGGSNATRTTKQATDTIVWLATLSDNGPAGCFFRDRKIIEW